MNNENFIVLIAVLTVLALIIAILASLGRRFVKEPSRQEANHAIGKRLCVRSVLQKVRVTFFVGKRDVQQQNKVQSEHKEKENRKNSIAMLFLPSVLSIGICLICVCGMTWAWFTSSVQTPIQQTTSAHYTVTVESVTDGGTSIEPTADGYELQAGKNYTVTLRAEGTVKECGGYCLIENADKSLNYYTQTFKPDETITITFTPNSNDTYTFTDVWGSIPSGVKQENIIKE